MCLIALCDDERADLNKVEWILRDYEKEHPEMNLKIECFKDSDELFHVMREKNYSPDLILLDIYMPGKTGIEAAEELRSIGNRSRIVFLTASKEHALEAFEVEASQYIVKPVSKNMLFPIMDKFLRELENEHRSYLLFRIEGKIRRVQVSDIVYCEAQRKIQYLYLTDGSRHLLRMTMTEIYEMLSPYQKFARVGIAYIMNLEHVAKLNRQDVFLDTGQRVYLPRGAYKNLKEQYFRYFCEES